MEDQHWVFTGRGAHGCDVVVANGCVDTLAGIGVRDLLAGTLAVGRGKHTTIDTRRDVAPPG